MRYFTLACLLSVFGGLSLGSGAIAQTPTPDNLLPDPPVEQPTIDVPFVGRVLLACSFDTPDPGRLVPVGIPIAEVLSSLEPGGNPGQVNVRCNGDSNLLVNVPVQTDGPSVPTTDEEAQVTSPFGNTDSSGAPLNLPPGEVIPLTVDMSVRAVDTATGFPPGSYRYKVTLVVVP